MSTLSIAIEDELPQEIDRLLSNFTFSAEELASSLLLASRLGQVDTIGKLLSCGADVDAAGPPAEWSSLHVAVEHDQVDAVRELVSRGANVHARSSDGMTPLHLAVDVAADAHEQSGEELSLEMVRVLLELGADPALPDNSGRTPRHWAAEAGADAIVSLLDSSVESIPQTRE